MDPGCLLDYNLIMILYSSFYERGKFFDTDGTYLYGLVVLVWVLSVGVVEVWVIVPVTPA